MADSFNKKEREKKRKKRKKDKAQKREQKKLDGNTSVEFMYLDGNGNLTTKKPDPSEKNNINLEDVEISTRKQGKSEGSNFTKAGKIKFYNTEKGYGFLVDEQTEESYFFHADSLHDDVKDNDKVTFEIGKGPRGPVAVEVKLQ
jgi:cold shock CspA family protein